MKINRGRILLLSAQKWRGTLGLFGKVRLIGVSRNDYNGKNLVLLLGLTWSIFINIMLRIECYSKK